MELCKEQEPSVELCKEPCEEPCKELCMELREPCKTL